MAWVRDTKPCWRCKATKPANAFNHDASRYDGLRATCRECCSDESAAYRTKHRAQVLARESAFNAANPGSVRGKSRRYYERHRDRERQRTDAYRSAHLEMFREFAAKRRALKRQTAVGQVDFARIRARDGMCCHLCGEPVVELELHFDHVIPLSKGGPHVESNIAVSHAKCNQTKSARLLGTF